MILLWRTSQDKPIAWALKLIGNRQLPDPVVLGIVWHPALKKIREPSRGPATRTGTRENDPNPHAPDPRVAIRAPGWRVQWVWWASAAVSRGKKHAPAARPLAPTAPARRSNFEIEFFVEDDGRPVVRDWLRSLSLTKKQVLGSAMREVLQQLGIGVCGTEFGKHLGQGLFEFRLRQKRGDVQT